MNIIKKILIILLLSISEICYANLQDTVLYANIYFKINTNIIIQNNDYNIYNTIFLPNLFDNIQKLDTLYIYGSCSPEGPINFNKKLTKLRIETILKDLNIDQNKIQIEYIINDLKLFPVDKQYVYPWLRKVTLKAVFHKEQENNCDTIYIKEFNTDTLYINKIDTLCNNDTVYIDRPYKKIPIVNIKTNLVTDALLAPNAQIEIYTHLWGLSIEAEYTHPWWVIDEKHIYYQLLNFTVGIRKYFSPEYTKHYVGIYGNSSIYDLSFSKNKGYQGEIYGFGLTYGYVFNHKKYTRLKFEPYIRIGYLHTNFDSYHAGNPYEGKYYYDWDRRASEFIPRRFRVNYFGPTMIGFNISYDLICIRKYSH